MGHEFSGYVEEIGSGVIRKDLHIGDPVTVDPLIYCNHCRPCMSGNVQVCSTLHLYGTDCDGGMAELVAVDPDSVIPLPKNIDIRLAACCEPVAVVVHGLRQLRNHYFDSVCVAGLGPIGLLSALMLQVSGVRNIFCLEPNKHRQDIAKQLGLKVFDPLHDDVVHSCDGETDGDGVDLFVEASGSPAIAEMMTDLTAIRGEILQLSVFKQKTLVDLHAINFKEQTITGTRCYRKTDFIDAIPFVRQYPNIIQSIISSEHCFGEGQKIFMDLVSGKTKEMKVLFNSQKE
jgi:threonine dehydrogenase-like Zn-dependent dehydrogenase